MSDMKLLSVENLSVDFAVEQETVSAVRNVSFAINKGETLALVGESGSGKSVTALSILKLLPYPKASHPSGSIYYEGEELLTADDRQMQAVRGNKISMIFQEPMSSLNPLHTVEKQIKEVLYLHSGRSAAAIKQRVLELLELVGIADAANKCQSYPHELSGGAASAGDDCHGVG